MRLLLVEDEPKLARALKKALEGERYAVDVSNNGDDGLAMASTEPYDLLIIDRMLPGDTDGLKLVKSLRDDNIHTPALILTALGRVEDKTAGLDSGADDYMVKPFAIDELLARIRALLRRPPSSAPTILKVDDLQLDTTNLTVVHQGKPVQLTAKEFSLLEYLMRNAGRIVSKEAIISHVWDYDADILPNTVEVYVKYLRAKIDKPFGTRLIRTVRGFGYCLGAAKTP